jgi:hypothetical protein
VVLAVQAIETSKPSNTIERVLIIAPSYVPLMLYSTSIPHGDLYPVPSQLHNTPLALHSTYKQKKAENLEYTALVYMDR